MRKEVTTGAKAWESRHAVGAPAAGERDEARTAEQEADGFGDWDANDGCMTETDWRTGTAA